MTSKAMVTKDLMVTVVVVTYNQERWIRQTLDNILAQETSYPYEVIIGEDGGTDGTRAICSEYADKYEFITLLPAAENMGVTANWIRCVQAGKGKYIMSCAGDDYWHNHNKIHLQVDFMEQHPECVICHTDIDVLYVKKNKISHSHKEKHKIVPPEGKIQGQILQGRENISAVTMCIRRDAFEKYIPMDKFVEMKFPREDWPTLLILSAYGDIRYIPVSTATYRTGQESITTMVDYDKIRRRAEKDKEMTEYLYTLFPEWGPFKDGPYFDTIVNHHIVMAAYRNNDYPSAHEYAKKDIFSNKATRCAKTWLTFQAYRILHVFRQRQGVL